MTNEDIEIKITDIFNIFIKRWTIVILPGLLISIIIAFITYSKPKKYESFSLINIGISNSTPIETISSIKTIMQTRFMIEKILTRLNMQITKENINTIYSSIRYEEVSGLLKISAEASSPEKAQSIVEAVTDIIFERHKILFEQEQTRFNEIIKFIKNMVNPIPLSTGIREFYRKPTVIEIPPQINPIPINKYNNFVIVIPGIITIILCSLIVFYFEFNKKFK